jgi:hypothetical protein
MKAETFRTGWLQKQISKSKSSLDTLPPKLRETVRQPTSSARRDRAKAGDEDK